MIHTKQNASLNAMLVSYVTVHRLENACQIDNGRVKKLDAMVRLGVNRMYRMIIIMNKFKIILIFTKQFLTSRINQTFYLLGFNYPKCTSLIRQPTQYR